MGTTDGLLEVISTIAILIVLIRIQGQLYDINTEINEIKRRLKEIDKWLCQGKDQGSFVRSEGIAR